MSADPSQSRILLVGPRVVHLKPFFDARRYNCVAVQKGVEGMTALDAEPRDIVILELNLGDLTATEFLMAARQAHAQASFLLLDDASKAGQIVKALQAGLDGYLPTPPDEDRLFFEVERHLRGGGGNGMNTGETQLTTRPQEFTDLHTQLADRESQLVEIGMQNDLLQQEIGKAREQAKAFQAVRGALVGVLEGDLDEAQAVRLRERLAMATVLETEVEALREELSSIRSVRRELQEQVDTLRKKVTGLEGRLDEKNEDSLEGAALKDRVSELESEIMVLEGRLAESGEELDLARAEVVALEQKHDGELSDLQRELSRVSSDQAATQGDSERATQEAAQTVARLKEEHEEALARLKEEHEAALKRAVSDVEIERATVQTRVQEAIDAERKRLQAEAGGQKGALEQELQAAIAEREQAVGRALDIELVLDELKLKIEMLESDVEKEKERATKAEETFKKDKLRLIEEKEVAASGSGEAFEKVQKFLDENTVLKRQNAELEAMRVALEQKATAGEEAQMNAALQMEQAAIIRAEAIQQRDTAEGARRAIEDRCAQLEQRAAGLEKSLEEERQRLLEAERALGDAGSINNKLADVTAAKDALEKEAERLGEKLAESEGALLRVQDELEHQRSLDGDNDALVADLKERIGKLEDTIIDREAAANEAKEALVTMQQELEAQHKSLTEHYEVRLKDAAEGNPGAATDALAERDAYRQRLAETEAWVQQAQVHLEALRVERDQLAAQATALANDIHARGAESQELYAQLSQAKQQVEQLTARAAGLEQELNAARQQQPSQGADPSALAEAQAAAHSARQQVQQAQHAMQEAQDALQQARAEAQQARAEAQAAQAQAAQGQGPDPRAFAAAQDEVRALQQQLQALQMQMAQGGGGRLPEELEPLRWTLTAAIDAITTLEQREPSLGAHLRNLRLLANTLARLSPSG